MARYERPPVKAKHSGWSEREGGGQIARIGGTTVEIFPPSIWKFYRGSRDPVHVGGGQSFTVAFRGSHSGGAFTLDGAKALALWTVQNRLTGRTPPDSIFDQAELDERAKFRAIVTRLDAEYPEHSSAVALAASNARHGIKERNEHA